MKIYVGVTDGNWHRFLEALGPDEVNFWQPGGNQPFKVLKPNELFLFKLHSPIHKIVGGGFFVRHSFLPVMLAWETFGQKNGAPNYEAFKQRIYQYKRRKTNAPVEANPMIGCIVLAAPFFLPPDEWIDVPEDWKGNIVQGKSYDTETGVGRRLWLEVQDRLAMSHDSFTSANTLVRDPAASRFGSAELITPRLGQGAFRVVVMEAYHRRCAITGEKTLPVLDAAHILPYAQDGPHTVSNGLLLRQDFHTLFDRGYVTINEDYEVEISKRIKEDYGNGREYYALHGKRLSVLPDNAAERPARDYLRWHNEHVFLG